MLKGSLPRRSMSVRNCASDQQALRIMELAARLEGLSEDNCAGLPIESVNSERRALDYLSLGTIISTVATERHSKYKKSTDGTR